MASTKGRPLKTFLTDPDRYALALACSLYAGVAPAAVARPSRPSP
jgi:hypothetical protein